MKKIKLKKNIGVMEFEVYIKEKSNYAYAYGEQKGSPIMSIHAYNHNFMIVEGDENHLHIYKFSYDNGAYLYEGKKPIIGFKDLKSLQNALIEQMVTYYNQNVSRVFWDKIKNIKKEA